MEARDNGGSAPVALPARPIERLTGPLARFLHLEAASGVVLLACTAIALGFANSPLAASYQAIWDQTLTISLGSFELAYPLWYWINDALMALFFFVIGLEIKRELVHGELRDPASRTLPVAAALGGVVVPVGLFLLLLGGAEGRSAWAVPMATDIAFVVGCLALLGQRVPRGLKVLVLSLAIVDDILAVLVIAFFYTASLEVGWLVGALAGLGGILLLDRARVRAISVYVLVGTVIWLCTLKSGLHPTVAGVALGLLTPARAWLGQAPLLDTFQKAVSQMRSAENGQDASNVHDVVSESMFVAREAVSPLERLERGMHPWVAFVIMPIFALANAGVAFQGDSLAQPLSLAVAGGLVLGKPIGIVLAIFLLVRTGLARLPGGVTWPMILGAGSLAGIGFTMALFVASLGLTGQALLVAKGGVLLGSAISLVVGFAVLFVALRRGQEERDPASSPVGPRSGTG